MQKSKARILMNAEAFGFGPTAAIATFFPDMRERFERCSYIGAGHTLDLQRGLPYDQIFESEVSAEVLKKLRSEYDIFFTACDFVAGEAAKKAGFTVYAYDPLAWYWRPFPSMVKTFDLYLAQDFFGVQERLERESNLFPKASLIVPPIVSQKRVRRNPSHVLLNLGGLQNPLWSETDAEQYARFCIELVQRALPNEKLIVTGNSKVAAAIKTVEIHSFTRGDMHHVLEAAKAAFMTPGLGNIYDAAKFDLPTVWLPPANDSQGRQLELIKSNGMSDGDLDWNTETIEINYEDEQPRVLEQIASAVHGMRIDPTLESRFEKRIHETIPRVLRQKGSATSRLLDVFGMGGEEAVSRIVYEHSFTL